VDFELNDDQSAVLEAVDALLAKHAGPARAIELQAKGAYDFELDQALGEAGFVDVARDEGMGGLEAALVVEAVAKAAGVTSVGAAALVAPALVEEPLPTPIAMVRAGQKGPIRFAAHARTLLVLGDAGARVVELEPGDSTPVASNFGFPMGSVPPGLESRGRSLGAGSAESMRSMWRVSLALEAVGRMRAALDYTVQYLKERRQFGRAIASFQAVQHRLAECAIAVEGSRWLCYETAYKGATEEAAAAAASYAMSAAAQIFAETHQLSGAIGFTREHDLHVWSMGLQALRLELDGVSGHRRALVEARWGTS
jgi:alkylation response protein AidB-like acyl-CoA dehydrogenase